MDSGEFDFFPAKKTVACRQGTWLSISSTPWAICNWFVTASACALRKLRRTSATGRRPLYLRVDGTQRWGWLQGLATKERKFKDVDPNPWFKVNLKTSITILKLVRYEITIQLNTSFEFSALGVQTCTDFSPTAYSWSPSYLHWSRFLPNTAPQSSNASLQIKLHKITYVQSFMDHCHHVSKDISNPSDLRIWNCWNPRQQRNSSCHAIGWSHG